MNSSWGRIDTVSLARDTLGDVKSSYWFKRVSPDAASVWYVKKGCGTCHTKRVVPVFYVATLDAGPTIWEGYYCECCGRFYWTRPMQASLARATELRAALKRCGFTVTKTGDALIARYEYRQNSAIASEKRRTERIRR